MFINQYENILNKVINIFFCRKDFFTMKDVLCIQETLLYLKWNNYEKQLDPQLLKNHPPSNLHDNLLINLHIKHIDF